jgi:Domain of Unknown Function (DUF1206)
VELSFKDRSAPVRAERSAESAVSRQDPFDWLARPGLVARGVVYGVIGILAIKLVVGSGGKATNQQGALQTIAQQPFGKVLLIAMAVGLVGYAGWRLLRAAVGHGSEEADSGFDRVAAAASGLCYGALCVVAVKILAGSSSGSGSTGGSHPSKTTAGVLGWSGGTAIVGLAGSVLLGVGLYQGYKVLTAKFMEETATEKMGPGIRDAYQVLGVFGQVSRMVVFVLTGYGLLAAALDYDPHKAVGLDGALRELANGSFGPILLGVVAAGLIGFALFSFAEARFRRV